MAASVDIRLGVTGTQAVLAALSEIGSASERVHASLAGQGAAGRGAAASVGLARNELINVSRQLQDVAISLQGGQSPFLVLTQQGSQLVDVLATSNATLGGMARQALGLLTPLRLVAGGFVALGAAAGLAFAEYASSQRELANSLSGLGRGAGATVDQLNRIADAASRVGNISRASAREAVGIFAATGRIDPGTAGQLAGVTRAYGLQTGQDTTAAAKELAGAFADPVKGAEMLNEKLGILDAKTREYIRSQIAMGERGAAQKAMLEALNPAIADAEKRVGALGRAWNWAGQQASNFSDEVGKALNGPVLETRIKNLRDQINAFTPVAAQMQKDMAGVNVNGTIAINPNSVLGKIRADAKNDPLQPMKDYLEELEGQLRHAQFLADLRGDEQKKMRETTQATDRVRSLMPFEFQRRQLVDNKTFLEKALGDPEVVARLGESAKTAREALAALTAQIAGMKEPAARVQEDTRLSVQATLAYTMAERVAAETERARIQAIREGKSALEVAAEAEAVRAKAIAEATKQLRDAARDSRDAVSLIGLSPYARARQEIENARKRQLDTLTMGEGGGAGGMDAGFAGKLKTFMDAIGGITISSGYRSPERQAELWADAVKKYGSEEAARKQVAPPGSSMHNFGMAADLRFASPEARAEAHRRAAEFGLTFPMKHEPWHIEPIGGRRTSVPLTPGEGRRLVDEAAGNKIRVLDYETQVKPIEDVNKALDAQIKLQGIAAATYQSSTQEIVRAAEAQRLYNEFASNGVKVTPLMSEAIQDYARRAGEAAQRVEDINTAQKRYESFVGDLKSTASDVFRGIISDVREGKKGIDVLTGAATRLAERLTSMATDAAINQLFGALFGKAGGGQGGGILGTALYNLFSGPNGGVITGGGALYGPGFANGGIMTQWGPMPLNAYAGGGIANSPQMAIFGEGRRAEAYVPLPDNRTIPVTLSGGRGGNVTINNYGNSRVQARPDPATGDLEIVIDQVESRLARRASDGSALAKAIGGRR